MMQPDLVSSQIYLGDARIVLPQLPVASMQVCVTSPPYWLLRDFRGKVEQVGLEANLPAYIAAITAIFREVRRVLKPDGCLFLNVGDTYTETGSMRVTNGQIWNQKEGAYKVSQTGKQHGLKRKELMGIPWRLALSLQEDGWYLRQDLIWLKESVKPESVKDRCTREHDYVFLLTRSPQYYFNASAIREPAKQKNRKDRHCRSAWTIPPKYLKSQHPAKFPLPLAERCILVGSRPGDTVLDPFLGSGTTAIVALQNGRNIVGIELDEVYQQEAMLRIEETLQQRNLLEKHDASQS